MMISEFIERTGFEPTASEYVKIEEAYCDFDGDKDAFCKAFVEQGGEKKVYQVRAAEIDQLRSQIMELEKMFKADSEKQEKQIAGLQAQLDKELEWKPSTGPGTNMEQSRYEELAGAGRQMTDQEARDYIADECSFSADKITIFHKVSAYEVNKYHRLRVAAKYDRSPVYESTDWNYVRFDCASFMYELVNGELRFYYC